jgi:hypothetical protein
MGGNQYEMGVWIKSGGVPPLMIALRLPVAT